MNEAPGLTTLTYLHPAEIRGAVIMLRGKSYIAHPYRHGSQV
jgi:hypothetical protein